MMSYRSLLVIPLMILLGCKDYALKEPFRAENGLYGYKDGEGKIIIKAKYDEAETFSNGLAKVKLDGKWGFVDKTGTEVIELKYDWVVGFHEGLAGVELNGKWGFVDKTGTEVIPLKYDSVERFREGLAGVELNGKWGFVDQQGKEYWTPDRDEALRQMKNPSSL